MTDLPDPATPDLDAVDNTRGIARSSLGILVASIIGNAGFFVSALILARVLGPSGRGALAFFTVSALFGSNLVSLGLPGRQPRSPPRNIPTVVPPSSETRS